MMDIKKIWKPFSKMESANGYVMINKDDYVRARDCVNSMVGISNPYAAISELERLRTEKVRLQSVIDEDNAQEPDGFVCNGFWYPTEESGKLCEGANAKCEPKYAHPIPAQQSPAVAFPDSDGVSIIEAALKKVSSGNLAEAPFPLIGENAQCYLNGAASAYQHALEMLCVSSPRITEQDAEAIIESYVESPDCFNDWIASEGRSLLNKLNGDQNGK